MDNITLFAYLWVFGSLNFRSRHEEHLTNDGKKSANCSETSNMRSVQARRAGGSTHQVLNGIGIHTRKSTCNSLVIRDLRNTSKKKNQAEEIKILNMVLF